MMGRRATLETADAPFAESRKGAVASRETHEHNIFDHGLQRRRETDNITITTGQEGDGKLVWQQTVWHLGQFERLIVAVRHCREHAAPGPVQRSALLLDRHHAVGGMLIVAGIVREFVRRMRILVAGLLSRVLVDLKMSNKFLALLAEAPAPADRIS